MEKILLLLMAVITVVSCNKIRANGFIITGKVNDIENSVSIFLQKRGSTGLDPKLKAANEGKKIKKSLDSIKNLSIGSPAPDFSGLNPEGKIVSLKESMGKLTIVDFWASWCASCRRENQDVVALYKEFHDKGLNIVGVSLDKDGNKWKEAIAKDKLIWIQISNLKGWGNDPIALKYNIKGLPAVFLVDADGKIIAKDVHGAELKARVAAALDL